MCVAAGDGGGGGGARGKGGGTTGYLLGRKGGSITVCIRQLVGLLACRQAARKVGRAE